MEIKLKINRAVVLTAVSVLIMALAALTATSQSTNAKLVVAGSFWSIFFAVWMGFALIEWREDHP